MASGIIRGWATGLIVSIGFACAVICFTGAQATDYSDVVKDAVAKQDIAFCASIDKDYCLDDFCESVDQAQDNCRVAVAVAKGDPDFCLRLGSKRSYPSAETPTRRCLGQIAQATHRADICAKIPPEQESNEETLNSLRCHALALVSNRWCPPADAEKQARLFRDECRRQAIATMNECKTGFLLVENIKMMSDPLTCAIRVAMNMRDARICDQLSSADQAMKCTSTIKQWLAPPPSHEGSGGP